MEKIQNALQENPYLANCEDTVFTVLLRHAVLQTPHLSHLKDLTYIHGLLQYPKWESNSDIFQYISPKNLNRIRKGRCFFIFDSSTEGFSPIKEFPFFDMLYYNCEKYQINPKQIIYVSSNLRDEKNIETYARERNLPKFKVFSFLSFEQVLSVDNKRSRGLIDYNFEDAKIANRRLFQQYYFSSLSRVNREWRTYGTLMLWSSDVRSKGLISHDVLPRGVEILERKRWPNITKEQIELFVSNLPLIVDQNDFNRNWALDTPYRHIHDQTLFQIVNETLVDDRESTTLFYSEKTFRPIAYFQPMIIWGQQGANKHLAEVGYKTYEDWFDLSFDDEPDNTKRYLKLLDTVKETCKHLDSMTRDQKLEWRFKNQDVLKHNFSTMIDSAFSKSKLIKFLENFNAS